MNLGVLYSFIIYLVAIAYTEIKILCEVRT